MKKLIFTFIITLIIPFHQFAQEILVLQPDANDGKDARIHSCVLKYNSGITPEFLADAWTWGGEAGAYRSLIDFDFNNMPQPIIRSGSGKPGILYAKLYLYAFPEASSEGHSMLSGSNECLLQRITSDWEENTVKWSNQPSVTTLNQVTITETNNENKDYEIDVTQLIRDIFEYPEQSFGMMLKMKDENHYRRMTFASSDHPDPAKHPKLVICFDVSSINEKDDPVANLLHIYPNPSDKIITMEWIADARDNGEIKIFDIQGKVILELMTDIQPGLNQVQIDVSGLPSGLYSACLIIPDQHPVHKMISIIK